jgi:hypothetical protein
MVNFVNRTDFKHSFYPSLYNEIMILQYLDMRMRFKPWRNNHRFQLITFSKSISN